MPHAYQDFPCNKQWLQAWDDAMMEEVLREAIDPNVPEFVKKVKRAQERYFFWSSSLMTAGTRDQLVGRP